MVLNLASRLSTSAESILAGKGLGVGKSEIECSAKDSLTLRMTDIDSIVGAAQTTAKDSR